MKYAGLGNGIEPYNGVQAAPNLGAGGMMNGMMPGGMPGQGMGMGMGMQPGMMGGMQGMGMGQMGMGQMGMPGMQGMGQMGGMGMQPGMMGQMGMGGMNGMAQIGGMGIQPGMMGLQQGVPPHGSIGESQAAPVSHRHRHLLLSFRIPLPPSLFSILQDPTTKKKCMSVYLYTNT